MSIAPRLLSEAGKQSFLPQPFLIFLLVIVFTFLELR